MAAGHHRAGDQADGGLARRHRAHQLRRHGLVAAAHQHYRVHGLRAHHFLGVHGHEVAELEAGRIEEHLAERDGGEFDRQRAGRQHAALHGVQHLGKVAVAVVETGRRIGDADHRLLQHRARVAHGGGEGAAQIEREIAVAVIGEAVGDAGGVGLSGGHGETLWRGAGANASRGLTSIKVRAPGRCDKSCLDKSPRTLLSKDKQWGVSLLEE